VFNLLKTEFLLNNIYTNSVRTSQETSRLHYKAQPVNAVWGNNRCLLENHREHTNALCGQNAAFWYVKAGGTYTNH
jgi:hypothetical protein